MTLNDIKISALQLMFTNYSDDLRNENVDEMTNEEYTKYTLNMDASINRCLGRLETAGVLSLGSVELEAEDGIVGDYNTKFDLSELATDFRSVARVIYENGSQYEPSIGYTMEGDTIVLSNLKSGVYRVLYNRRITRIVIGALSSTEVGVPDYLAEIIPYFIKSELYEEEEPEIASQARNIFEAMLSTFIRTETSGQSGVVNIFGGLQ